VLTKKGFVSEEAERMVGRLFTTINCLEPGEYLLLTGLDAKAAEIALKLMGGMAKRYTWERRHNGALVVHGPPAVPIAGGAELWAKTKERVLALCAHPDGCSLGKIKIFLKSKKTSAILESVLADLVAAGLLRREDGIHFYNKQPFTKFWTTEKGTRT
jgi:hypothetical protein